jgi:hypothetical protein
VGEGGVGEDGVGKGDVGEGGVSGVSEVSNIDVRQRAQQRSN